MKAYKVFDSELKCRDFQYKIGKTYSHDGQIELCSSGFHACKKINHCFNYYSFNSKNRVCQVEMLGEIVHGEDKSVCSKIKIIKEIKWSDVLVLSNSGSNNSGHSNSGDRNSGYRNSGDSNSGDWNSGDSNSGHRNSGDSNSGHRNSGYSNSGYRNSGYSNSGDWNSGHSNSGDRNSGYSNSGYRNSGDSNSGDWNSGHRNSGHRNSGDWNSGDWNSGYFNSKSPEKIYIFNRLCDKKEWDISKKPNFIYNVILTKWVSFNDMNEVEKKENPKAFVCDGYLKLIEYKEAWNIAFEKASKEDIELLKKLPNFDSKIFEEITGIKINI